MSVDSWTIKTSQKIKNLIQELKLFILQGSQFRFSQKPNNKTNNKNN